MDLHYQANSLLAWRVPKKNIEICALAADNSVIAMVNDFFT